jgi:uncharacterized repeat protein (TIGR01451 family)
METPPGVTCTVTTEINCTLGNIGNGDSVIIRAHGRMASSTTRSTLTNVAYASTTSYDPNQNNNVASDTIALIRTADLAITKTPTPTSAPAGSAISYTLSVTNNGSSDAQDVVISDLVDNATQISLTNVTGTTGGATCAALQSSSLRCTITTLAAGATATVGVQGVLSSNLGGGVVVGNSATVTAATADPDSSNNRAIAQVTTTAAAADLQVTKTGPTTAVAGTTITYTIVATNIGPSDALASSVTDDIPADIVATSVSTTRGTCNLAANTPTVGRQRMLCTFPGLPASSTGAGATITLTGTVAAGATASQIANTATIASDNTDVSDPVTGNNTSTAMTNVTRAFDVGVTKQANRASLPAATPMDTRDVD